MSIFTNTNGGNGKSKWTKEQDAVLFASLQEGKGRAEIAAATTHPENSITYRARFLKVAEKAALDKGIEINSIEDLLKTIKY